MKTIKQIDFYPNGRVDYFYDDGSVVTKQSTVKALTPAEALQKRLEEHKLNKVSEELIDEYDEAYKKLK